MRMLADYGSLMLMFPNTVFLQVAVVRNGPLPRVNMDARGMEVGDRPLYVVQHARDVDFQRASLLVIELRSAQVDHDAKVPSNSV